jgi:hypothetical protein
LEDFMLNRSFALCLLFVVGLCAASIPAQAQEDSPIQLALFTPIQIFPENYSISGVRLNLLYGRNVAVTGVDFGLINHTTSGETVGFQWGGIGLADGDFVGWQDNVVNVVRNDFEGFQWGLVNYANHASGFQLGLVNYAVTLHGLQIGLVNVIKQGGQFPVFPIINWSF